MFLHIPEAHSFHLEYSSLACTIEFVDDVHAAIDHIHEHGRHVGFFFLHEMHFNSLPLFSLCTSVMYVK